MATLCSWLVVACSVLSCNIIYIENLELCIFVTLTRIEVKKNSRLDT